MQILIQNKVIETKNIADIVDVEADKKMFLNREAGFKIIFLDDSPDMVFSERIAYESYPSEISAIKNKWQKLMNKVIIQWKTDGIQLPTFKV